MEAVWRLVLTGLVVASGLAEKQQDLTVSWENVRTAIA